MRLVTALLVVICSLTSVATADSEGQLKWTLTNPTGRTYVNEPVRLKVNLPESFNGGNCVVTANGREVPYQIERTGTGRDIWVAASLGENESVEYVVKRGKPTNFKSLVPVTMDGEYRVISNGLVTVRILDGANGTIPPGPIAGIRTDKGKWIGCSFWHTDKNLSKYTAKSRGGKIFAKMKLRYDFEEPTGLGKNVIAFADIDIIIYPGARHILIEESHEMGPDDYWEFDCAAGWNPRYAACQPHGSGHAGDFSGKIDSLKIGQTRMYDTLLNLQARWSQAFDEGWFFYCHDNNTAVGAVPVFASRWHWPHNNLISVKVKDSADYAGLRCPTWKGRRAWFLLAGPEATWNDKERKRYITNHAFQPLDKLHHDYVLDWPNLEKILTKADPKRKPKLGAFRGMDFYSSWMNPTSMLRGFGKRAITDAGKQGNLDTLTQMQVFFDNDSYGSYWNYWSPENPNFYTDFIKPGIAMVARLRNHPNFKDFAKTAEQKLRTDIYHSVTLPGGAGQECPGYVAYAMKHYKALAPLCKQYLSFDPTKWPRYKAGASFLLHLSQPISDGNRRCHPGGDTHPMGPDVIALADEFGVKEDMHKFRTEELPGFGVVFRNNPGTEKETYLAFKSGPNRGHYHGDQLSFHYCADARQVAVDHMCSYSPRAGAEHMHNRVAFHTEQLPYANMDGYERVIAFKTSRDVDIAIGQVESERLRITNEYPPEDWDTYLPQERFDELLKYRRTIVCVKNQGKDYFVIRDQYAGPEVKATYCLHVLSDKCDKKEGTIDFGNLTLVCVKPAKPAYGRHDWPFERKDKKTKGILLKEHTKGIRLTTQGRQGEFITVLYPGDKTPNIESTEQGVRVGADEIIFGGSLDDIDTTEYVVVKRKGRILMTVTGDDIDMDRFQGDVGLFVPDAGYPFGTIPDWLIKQRAGVPDWAPDWARQARFYELDRSDRLGMP